MGFKNSGSILLLLATLSTGALAATEPVIDATAFLGDHYPARHTSFPDGVVGVADVAYEIIPGYRPLTLDVYLPSQTGTARPLVLYIHGGGWTTGHARQSGAFDDWPRVLASLAARGYTVASLNYRLSSEAPFPAAIQDVKAAIKFLRAQPEYGIDPNKAMTWGGSAGGHLAALAALTCGVKELEPQASKNPNPQFAKVEAQSDCVQGAVTWYGIFDMTTLKPAGANTLNPAIDKFLDCRGVLCTPDKLEAASPQHYVNGNAPPFMLIHGGSDMVVDPDQSKQFQEALKAAGAKADLLIIPAVDHSFVGASAEATRAASLQALKRTFSFIDATMRPNR